MLELILILIYLGPGILLLLAALSLANVADGDE